MKEKQKTEFSQEKKGTIKKQRGAKNPQGTAFDLSDALTQKAPSARKKRITDPKVAIKKNSKNSSVKTEKSAEKGKKKLSSPKNSNADFVYDMQEIAALPKRKSRQKPLMETLVEAQVVKRKSKKKKAVKIIFLGGVEEVGKNITAIEYENEIIVIDAGLSFPNIEDMPGIDLVVPDVSYLAQNKEKIKGVFLTHGHEDHIGGLSYLMQEIEADTPIYGTKLTLMLADSKLQERFKQTTNEHVVQAGDRIRVGAFEVEFVNVNHSISGACALAIRTPNGLIYHSGDFKIDLTPVSGESIDLKRIAELGNEGVLLYLGESTNIERPGYTMSETVVGATLDHLFSENIGRRMIIATFSSNVHRLQQIIDLAIRYKRRVALFGRSMNKVVEAATQIHELQVPDGILVDIEDCKRIADGNILILSTGAQGEPMSALTRMATGDANQVTIGENDTIIISATPIPGNEKMVYRVINNLYKKGARVVYESLEKIHVSGHACQEEHKILHSLLKPKFFVPVHGEYRHLKRHAELAMSLGMPERNIFIPAIGNCLEVTQDGISQGENVPAGAMLVDGEGVEDYGSSAVMKERLKMSADGVYSVALAVTGDHIVTAPVVETHGCMLMDPLLVEELNDILHRTIAAYSYQSGERDALSDTVRKALKNHFYKRKKQAPLIMVSVLEL